MLAAGEGTVTATAPGRLRVTYRLPGDRTTATEDVSYTLTSGKLNQVRTDGARPLWTLAGVEVTATSGGTLLSIGLDESARNRWARRLTAAASRVQAEGLPTDWTGGLVVQIPPEGRFAQVAGESVAASAITTCAAGTPRIVVNPVVLDQPGEWLDSTIVHEAVHVAMNTACGPAAPAWVVEGLAESVAARSDEATASRNRALARSHVRAHGVPDALPEPVESLTDYALAQVAVDALRENQGRDADDVLESALGPVGLTPAEVRRVTRWYREAMERLAA